MALDSKLLELLVCPVSKASLTYKKDLDELWCRASGLAFPIRDGIPVMLEEEARELTQSERDSLKD
ncbi:MAG: Trm112 family protein [Gammaproteobacteria bacterium]|nr:MAG: Trm112 family protein [Gammaproteobacteria bacterium]